MKYILISVFALLFTASCTDSLDYKESKPKKRPVYFLTATLEKTGREVRVMIDTLDTPAMCMRVTYEVAREVNLQWIKYPYPDQVQADNPFYNVPLYSGYAGEFAFLVDKDRYSYFGGEGEFSRQERLTGEHIDIVIGHDGTRRMFKNDLSALPIDKRMTVPYDWGTSEE